jgi:hypothetical protein
MLPLPHLVCDPGLFNIISLDELASELAQDCLVPQAPLPYFFGLLFFPPHLALPRCHLHLSGLARSFTVSCTVLEDYLAAIVPDSSYLCVTRFQPPPNIPTISRSLTVPVPWSGQILLGCKLKKTWHRRSTRHEWDGEAWRVHRVRYLFIALGA